MEPILRLVIDKKMIKRENKVLHFDLKKEKFMLAFLQGVLYDTWYFKRGEVLICLRLTKAKWAPVL